ncbi:MAG: DedA family protein [Candidatus Taylorbacteria bacterium]|nr:DedA family protein [Candidatus Taylorbacteria bacterium]
MLSFPIIHYIVTYGYLAILVGSFFEGETILVIGGLAVQQGFLELPLVFLCSLVGTMLSDNTFFFLGRFHGKKLVAKYKFFQKINVMSGKFSGRSGPFLAFAMRFMYGFRHLVPFSLGMSAIKTRTFFIFNFLGGLTWVLTIGLAGYFFGDLLEIILGRLRHYEFRIIVVAIVVVVLGHILYKFVRHRLKDISKIS